MKLLENVGLVQFFLYEREDLQVGRNTGFLGPNGTGKTALLDAIQAVMLAVDSNRTHYNAHSDGKKKARSLRDYCLGVYDQTEEGRCRDIANTYINLVFRDEATNSVVTAGVSLSASIQSPELVVNGLYILPGVDLSTKSQVELADGVGSVIPWKRFQHVAAELCQLAGTRSSAVFTTNREEFIRKLLVEHLAAPGDKPNPYAFRNAFARSLKLKEMEDLSTSLRDHLIESHPTNVREFRARLDQFRAVRDLIKTIKEQIERASTVCDKYAIVKRERIAETNLLCLKATYHVEHLGELVGDAEVTVEKLDANLTTSRVNLQRASATLEAAVAARDRAIAALNLDPEYRKQAGQAERLSDNRKELVRKQKHLQMSLQAMKNAVIAAGHLQTMTDRRGLFEDAMEQLSDLERIVNTGQSPPVTAISSALTKMAQIHDAVRSVLGEAEANLKTEKARKKELEISLERAGRGLAPLRDGVRTLHRVLSEAGIETKPVCDLVRITDPRWQPVIEAYLGVHIEALLVPSGREDDAIRIYADLKGAQAVYGVKLACPSRLRDMKPFNGRRLAGLLIEGDDQNAVRYLRGELGSVELAENRAELLAGTKAFMASGMIGTGGGVERRRMPGADELKIGRKDNAALQGKVHLELEESRQQEKAAGTAVEQLRKGLQTLAPFSNAEASQRDIEAALTEIRASSQLVQDLGLVLEETQTSAVDMLQENQRKADSASLIAKQVETECQTRVTTIGIELEQATAKVANLSKQFELASTDERAARLQPLYDANEVERHRARLDERHSELNDRIIACDSAISRASNAATNANRDAWGLMTLYLSDYHQTNNDLNGDWLPSYQYILSEKHRLEDMALAEQQEKSEEAYKSALAVFRTDVAQALIVGFDRIEEQVDGLNMVLKNAPLFSNNERYQFRKKIVDQHRPLYEFLQRVREFGGGENDMFGGAGEIPQDFRTLMEGDATSALLHDGSPLADYRRFFSFDVEISRDGKSIGWLSKRFGPGSGGEHRTPLYVIFGAALAAAYGNTQGRNAGSGIMLLDEAFEKMDTQNVRATAMYLNSLGLQMIMAGPETDQPKLSSFLDIYYDMGRYGGRTIQMDKTIVTESTRQLLQSDNPIFNPELMQQEMARLSGGTHGV